MEEYFPSVNNPLSDYDQDYDLTSTASDDGLEAINLMSSTLVDDNMEISIHQDSVAILTPSTPALPSRSLLLLLPSTVFWENVVVKFLSLYEVCQIEIAFSNTELRRYFKIKPQDAGRQELIGSMFQNYIWSQSEIAYEIYSRHQIRALTSRNIQLTNICFNPAQCKLQTLVNPVLMCSRLSLRHLSFINCNNINVDEGLKTCFSDFQRSKEVFPAIISLNLSNMQTLSNSLLILILQVLGANLKRLNIKKCTSLTYEAISDGVIAFCPNLERLQMSGCVGVAEKPTASTTQSNGNNPGQGPGTGGGHGGGMNGHPANPAFNQPAMFTNTPSSWLNNTGASMGTQSTRRSRARSHHIHNYRRSVINRARREHSVHLQTTQTATNLDNSAPQDHASENRSTMAGENHQDHSIPNPRDDHEIYHEERLGYLDPYMGDARRYLSSERHPDMFRHTYALNGLNDMHPNFGPFFEESDDEYERIDNAPPMHPREGAMPNFEHRVSEFMTHSNRGFRHSSHDQEFIVRSNNSLSESEGSNRNSNSMSYSNSTSSQSTQPTKQNSTAVSKPSTKIDSSISIPPSLSKLQVLDISDCTEFSSDLLLKIFGLDNQSDSAMKTLNLIEFDISQCRQLTEYAIVSIVQRCHSIITFNAANCENIVTQASHLSSSGRSIIGVTDYVLHGLSLTNHSLKYLRVSNCSHITDTGVRYIISACSMLQLLDLSGCRNISDATLEHLGNTRSCKLRSLYLNNCNRITSVGLIMLANSTKPFQSDPINDLWTDYYPLHILELRETNITRTGLANLLSKCEKLRNLDIRGCKNVTNSELATLSASHILQID